MKKYSYLYKEKEVRKNGFFSMIVYGKNGIGKSTFAKQFLNDFNITPGIFHISEFFSSFTGDMERKLIRIFDNY